LWIGFNLCAPPHDRGCGDAGPDRLIKSQVWALSPPHDCGAFLEIVQCAQLAGVNICVAFSLGANAAIWITSGEPFPFVAKQSMSKKCYHFPKICNDFNSQIRCPAHGVQGVGGSNPLIPTSSFKGLR
jgi:hypothetical protein